MTLLHTANDANIYVNWVIYAVLGKLQEADAILRQHGASVERVAASMRRHAPPPAKPLYRGVVLTHADAAPSALAPRPRVESWSFSEDIDCARWFACLDASISGAIVEAYGRAALDGYLMTCEKAPAAVLFHHTWKRIPFGAGLSIDVRAAAICAERAGAIPETGACQFEWALRTQAEVITKPPQAPIPFAPVGVLNARVLEERYGPPRIPWIAGTDVEHALHSDLIQTPPASTTPGEKP